ncbi:IS1096 element passenger TnpR family protein [Virgibacillus natechei]|nr:hypothetical protein [Virgibacillus natechei]UZD14104.1 plasmid pRiA4b ORF-3 family protein [Virgibacillus natechei]
MPFAKNIQVDEEDRLDHQLDGYENFLYYFGYFGLWEFEPKPINSVNVDYVRGTEPKSIKLMPRFKKLIPALVEAWNPPQDPITDSIMGMMSMFGDILDGEEEAVEEAEEELESLFTLLQPLFAKGELKNILLVPGEGESINGNFTLTASLHSSCWRRLRLPGSATLLDLHEVIQEAFGFDDDHLYSFFMDGKRFSKYFYNSPMDVQGPYVHEKQIGRLNLYEGKRFVYLFDFGDEWLIDIKVEKIEEEEEKPADIVEKKGEDPDQYEW